MVPIVPFTTDALSVSIGQRYDVIVEATQASGDYWLRGQWVTACATNGNPDGITGIIRYDAASTADPTSVRTGTTAETCYDEPLENLVPHLALDVGTINEIAYQDLDFAVGGPWFQWTLNGSSLELDWEAPTVLTMINNGTTFPLDYNVITVDVSSHMPPPTHPSHPLQGRTPLPLTLNPPPQPQRTPGATTAEYVVLVIQDDTGFGITHPIHLHGHDFWVLAQDTGMYHGNTSAFNTVNPPRRDVASLPGNGYLAIAFELDNPGAWIVHCHIAWHASEGLALEFVEDQSLYSIAGASRSLVEDQCASWNSYIESTTYNDYPQDDSGI